MLAAAALGETVAVLHSAEAVTLGVPDVLLAVELELELALGLELELAPLLDFLGAAA